MTDTQPTSPEEEGSETEAQPMNRAERRAAAKGKTGGNAAARPAMPSPKGGHTSGAAGHMRLPRTGHKGG